MFSEKRCGEQRKILVKNRELPYPIELDIQQEKRRKTRKISEKAKKHEKKLAQ